MKPAREHARAIVFFLWALSVTGISSDDDDCAIPPPYHHIPGTYTITGVFDIHEGVNCSQINEKGFSLMISTMHTVQMLNDVQYIPGVDIGLLIYDTCSKAEETKKAVIHSHVMNECTLSVSLGVLTTKKIAEELKPLSDNLQMNLSIIPQTQDIDVLVGSTVSLLNILNRKVIDYIITDHVNFKDSLLREATKNNICVKTVREFQDPNFSQMESEEGLLIMAGSVAEIQTKLKFFQRINSCILIPFDGRLNISDTAFIKNYYIISSDDSIFRGKNENILRTHRDAPIFDNTNEEQTTAERNIQTSSESFFTYGIMMQSVSDARTFRQRQISEILAKPEITRVDKIRMLFELLHGGGLRNSEEITHEEEPDEGTTNAMTTYKDESQRESHDSEVTNQNMDDFSVAEARSKSNDGVSVNGENDESLNASIFNNSASSFLYHDTTLRGGSYNALEKSSKSSDVSDEINSDPGARNHPEDKSHSGENNEEDSLSKDSTIYRNAKSYPDRNVYYINAAQDTHHRENTSRGKVTQNPIILLHDTVSPVTASDDSLKHQHPIIVLDETLSSTTAKENLFGLQTGNYYSSFADPILKLDGLSTQTEKNVQDEASGSETNLTVDEITVMSITTEDYQSQSSNVYSIDSTTLNDENEYIEDSPVEGVNAVGKLNYDSESKFTTLNKAFLNRDTELVKFNLQSVKIANSIVNMIQQFKIDFNIKCFYDTYNSSCSRTNPVERNQTEKLEEEIVRITQLLKLDENILINGLSIENIYGDTVYTFNFDSQNRNWFISKNNKKITYNSTRHNICSHMNCSECVNFQVKDAFYSSKAFIDVMKHLTIKTDVYIIVLLTISVIGIILSICIGTFIVVRIFKKDILEGNPLLTLLLLASVIFTYIAILPFVVKFVDGEDPQPESVSQNEDIFVHNNLFQNLAYIEGILCMIKIIMISTSFNLLFGIILARSLMLSNCDRDGSFLSHINGYIQVILLFFILLVQTCLNIELYIFNVKYDLRICSDSNTLSIYFQIYNTFLLILSVLTIPFIYKSKRNYNEGLYLTAVIIFLSVIWFVWIAIYQLYDVGNTGIRNIKEMTALSGLVASATGVLILIFIPRTYLMLTGIVRDNITASLPTLGYTNSSSVLDVTHYRSTQALYDTVGHKSTKSGQINPNYYMERPGTPATPSTSKLEPTTSRSHDNTYERYDTPPSPLKVTRF